MNMSLMEGLEMWGEEGEGDVVTDLLRYEFQQLISHVLEDVLGVDVVLDEHEKRPHQCSVKVPPLPLNPCFKHCTHSSAKN